MEVEEYENMMNRLEIISDVLSDTISVVVSIGKDAYFLDLKSSKNRSIEKAEGKSLVSTRMMCKGSIGSGEELKKAIVDAFAGRRYVYAAFGKDRHKFTL